MNVMGGVGVQCGVAREQQIKASGSQNGIVDHAQGASSSEGRSEVEGEEMQVAADGNTPGAGEERGDGSSGVDEVLYGALKKAKFHSKIREIEGLVREFVLGSEESELVFAHEITETTFERLLVHRVAQHWGLETRVLEDRTTIVGRWPAGRVRGVPGVELGSLDVVVEDEGRGGDKGKERRRVGVKERGRVRGVQADYEERQRQYYYQQMMYQQQQMMMYMQQGFNGQVNAGKGRATGPMGVPAGLPAGVPASPGLSSQPESPGSTLSSASSAMGSEGHAVPMGGSPMYQPPVYPGYGGPPMMMGGLSPYGMHVPVVPIMLPDGRIVYQQQAIQPVAVPPPPPPPPQGR